ncbi:unnamed protein product [Paramecium octaurelia]|uniref:Uncharacterized protein n=1 Tax=Paramecium octaurelia TaxID=43137 RepID=A0A8S1TI67_PAROT|nr:unnamed protein product [Paramecium octaurelia]
MFKIRFLGNFFSGSKDKQGVSCEQETNQNHNINGNTSKCMKQLEQKFQQSQNEIEYNCSEKDKFSRISSFIWNKILPNGDKQKKKCYESCLLQNENGQELNINNLCEHFLQSKDICQEQQKQCNQEVQVLLDCGHTVISKCCEREELQKSYICKQICMKIRSCGHSFNKCQNYCFQQECSPCMYRENIKKVEFCYQKDGILLSNTLCKECQNKNKNPKTQPIQNNPLKIKLKCGHTVQTTQDKQESILQSFKCQEKCTKKRLCQHDQACDNLCYQECTPCREIIEEVLPCGHIAKFQCFNAKQELQNYICHKPCNKKRPCHQLDPCLENSGNHIRTQCQKIVKKQLKCAQNGVDICSNKGNQCKEMCTRLQQCQHLCLKYCWEECSPCEQKNQKDFESYIFRSKVQ